MMAKFSNAEVDELMLDLQGLCLMQQANYTRVEEIYGK